MTKLAAGATANITLPDGGTLSIASNAGFGSVVATPVVGDVLRENFGPLQYRRVLGPFSEGATVALSSSTAELDYDQFPAVGESGVTEAMKAAALLPFTNRIRATKLAGSGITTVLIMGDSLTLGSGCQSTALNVNAGYPAGGWGNKLGQGFAAALRRRGFSAYDNGVMGWGGLISNYGTFDTRFTLAAEWVSTSINSVPGGRTLRCQSGTDPVLTYNPGVVVNNFVFHSFRSTSPAQGSFTHQAGDNAESASVNLNVGAAPGTLFATTIPVVSGPGLHSLLIKRKTGNVYAWAIRAYNDSIPEIEIITCGASGMKASEFQLEDQPYRLLPFLTHLAPHLTFIHFGTNEAGALTPDTVDVYVASMRNIIQRLKAAGSAVVLITQTPRAETVVALSVQSQYAAACRQLAVSEGCGLIDEFAKIVSYESNRLFANLYADDTHGNFYRYPAMGEAMASYVTA